MPYSARSAGVMLRRILRAIACFSGCIR